MTSLRMTCTLAIGIVSALAACRAPAHDSSTDAGNSGSDAGLSRPHGGEGGGGGGGILFPSMPNNGGLILQHPSIVTLTFTDDPDATAMGDFVDWIVTSDWLTAVGSEYGIGPGTNRRISMSPVHRTVTDEDIQQWLASNIAAGNFPAPGASNAPRLYVWFLAPSAPMYNADGTCTDGYHSETMIGTQHVPYAVVPTCPMDTWRGLTLLQCKQGRASHELIEAFTDPLPGSAPGYLFMDSQDVWTTTYGEVGDVCVWNYLPFTATNGTVYYAQRSWSNNAAELGGDPCVPRPAGLAYFNIVPADLAKWVLDDSAGATHTVPLTGWTQGTHGAWSIQATSSMWADFDLAPELSTTTMTDGGQATLTLHVPANATSGQHAGVVIVSEDGSTNSLWPIAIEVP